MTEKKTTSLVNYRQENSAEIDVRAILLIGRLTKGRIMTI
jgi:hypothetical protein